jgi:parvulin-like peptidyl-prolyl isomerase
MKRTVPCFLLLCLALAVPLHAVDVNRVVLRVNDRIATLVDYELRKTDRLRMIRGAKDLSPSRQAQLLDDAGKGTLRDMFDELLLLSRADQLGLQVRDAEVDQAIEQTKKSAGISSDEQFRQALAQSGMTEAQYRAQVRRGLLMNTVIGREVRGKIKLDEETLRHYYRQHLKDFERPEALHLQEVILLDSSDKSEQERREIGRRIQAEVAAGRKLEDVVKPYVASGVASGVVDLSWVHKGDLDAALEQVAWPLQEGEITPPVEGRGGLHLLQLLERRAASVTSFEDVRAQIEAREGNRLFQQALSDYMKKLEDEAYVVANPPPEAVGFREYGNAVPADLSAAVSAGETAAGEAVTPPQDEVEPTTDTEQLEEAATPTSNAGASPPPDEGGDTQSQP